MKKTIRMLLVSLFVMAFVAACGGDAPVENIEPDAEEPATVAPADTPEPEPTETEVPPTEPPPTETPQPSNAVTELEDVRTAVVRIVAEGSFVDPQEGFLLNTAGTGSGFIIDESGLAVTNNHVVTGAALLKVYVDGEDEPRNARLLGVSECSDLAMIDIEGDDLPYLEWYEGEINAGLDVYAAGYPLGDPEFTLTRGIVSKEEASGYTNWSAVDAVIEHDATINPGNSGGPLVTTDGQVVAVNYASNPNYNQYFAIGRDETQDVIAVLEEGEDVDSIGVNGVAVSDGAGLSGIWVSSVQSGSPADAAGLEGGDIITQMENLVLATDGTMEDYCDILRTHDPEDVLSIDVLRYPTGEVLEGQLNGDALEVVGSMESDPTTGGEGGNGSAAASYDYVTITDDSGAIEMEAPSAWSDTNGSPWESDGQMIGAALSASPDRQAFNETFDVPGVFFGASPQLAQQYTPAEFLDQVIGSYAEFCTYDGRFDYDDGLYAGVYDQYSDCGDSGASLINLAAVAGDGTQHLALVQVQTLTAADEEARSRILETFIASGDLSAAAPQSSGDTVYATDFDDVSDWSVLTVPDEGDYLAEERGGVLYIEVPGTDSTVYAIQDTVSQENVRIDAAVETVAGPNRNNISLVCRFNEDGWYEFSMNSGGYWYIWKYETGDGFTILDEGASTEINLQKAENELTAICDGNDLILGVNGVEVGSTTDTDFRSGGIGVSVTTFDIAGAGVEFDALQAIVP